MAGISDEKDESFAAMFERGREAMPRRRGFHGGERVDVTVVAIGRDAVFADLGAKQEGYFPRATLSDGNGKLLVEVGANIAAVVTRVDDASGQVELSPVYVRRTVEEHFSEIPPNLDDVDDVRLPIAQNTPLLLEGAHVRGKVTGIERYGVFVQIHGTTGRGGRGLVPASETGTPRGSDLKKHFSVGQDVDAKILNIADDGKIRLSISALAADAERADFEAFAHGGAGQDVAAKDPKKPAPKPSPRNFGTFADLLANKKKK